MTLNRNGTNKTLITDKKTDLTNAETMNSEARKAKDVNKQRSCVGDESNKKLPCWILKTLESLEHW